MISPIRKARLEPQISPSFPPVSMKAAMVNVYSVMAPCTPPTVVSRSSTSAEIDTFMIVVSITYTNDPNALTKHNYVKGQIGIQYDFGGLKRLAGR